VPFLAPSKRKIAETLTFKADQFSGGRPAEQALDNLYTRHRRHLQLLISRVNPRLPVDKVALRATLIAAQIEGLMLFMGAGKPQHPEFQGLRDEAMRMIVSYAAAK